MPYLDKAGADTVIIDPPWKIGTRIDTWIGTKIGTRFRTGTD